MPNEETNSMKIKDLFETTPLLEGRTEIESITIDKGRTISLPGAAFVSDNTTQFNTDWGDGYAAATAAVGSLGVAVNLTNGTEIKECIVHGNDTGNTWALLRKPTSAVAGNAETLATASINSTDTSISNAVVTNSTHCYWLIVTGLGTGDEIYGATITIG